MGIFAPDRPVDHRTEYTVQRFMAYIDVIDKILPKLPLKKGPEYSVKTLTSGPMSDVIIRNKT